MLIETRIGLAAEDGGHTVLLLAIDDHLLPFKRNLTYYLSKPRVLEQPVLTPRGDDPDAPDHRAAHFYGTVLFDEGRFRMWYYGKFEVMPRPRKSSLTCYAESDDGLHWTRPNLGQKLVRGSRDNNALDLPSRQTYGATVIKDEDDPDPRRRYKMVYNPEQESGAVADRFGRPISTLGTATSPNGIDWNVSPEWPIDVFAEHSSFFKHEGLYIVHGQGIFSGGGEGGSKHGRRGYAWVSADFEEWLPGWAEAFALPEPADPVKRGGDGKYDQVHLGVGASSFGNVQVGLYGLWHNQGTPPSHVGTSCDFGLVVSNDGIHFREPVKGHVYISRYDSPVTPVEGKDYDTILCQYNGILNVGDETRIYHGRWRPGGYGADYYAEVALATLPRDRWGALGLFPDEEEGWVWSAPVTLPRVGCLISLNADHARSMRVEVSDDRFGLLPDYLGSQAGSAQASEELESPVAWPGGDVSALGG